MTRFHAGGVTIFGVTRRNAPELPEAFQMIDADGRPVQHLVVLVYRLDLGKMQDRIDQHRSVTG